MFENAYSLLNVINELGNVRGRKKLQKIVHLLEISGTELPFKYEYHHYGPYSADLQEEVNFLVQQQYIEEQLVDGAYIYTMTEKGQQFKQKLEENGEFSAHLDVDLLNKLDSESSQFLEVVSTYAYLLDIGYNLLDAKDKVLELKPHLDRYLETAINFYNDHISN